jgi:hypothetical protein
MSIVLILISAWFFIRGLEFFREVVTVLYQMIVHNRFFNPMKYP